MDLAPINRRSLRAHAALGLVLNFFLNGAAAWFSFPPVGRIPLFARGNCVAGDAVGTSFFLPLTTCLVLTPIVRRALAPRGTTPPIARASLPAAIRLLPRNFVGRGALVGLACALTIAPATLALLGACGVEAMGRVDVTVFKAVYTALLGALVTPLLGLRALGDGDPSPGAQRR
jgi:hypothetical protein